MLSSSNMSRQYLTLNRYDGSLSGLLDGPAGPEDVVSPGGLATIQHHWTQGMGGPGDRTSDVFAGTGERYVSGEYGHMYHPNSHGSVHDYHYGPHTVATKDQMLSGRPYHWQTKKSNVENFTTNVSGDFDLIGTADESELPPKAKLGSSPVSKRSNSQTPTSFTDVETDTSGQSAKKKVSAYILLFIFLMAFITFDLWAETVHRFFKQKIHKGQKITWQRYVLYALGATILLLGFMYMIGVPIRDIEDSSLIPPF